MMTPPPPLSMDRRWKMAGDLIHELSREIDLEHTFQSQVDMDDIVRAVLYPVDREPFIKRLPTRDRYILGGFISTAIWRARDSDPSMLENEEQVVLTVGCLQMFFGNNGRCSWPNDNKLQTANLRKSLLMAQAISNFQMHDKEITFLNLLLLFYYAFIKKRAFPFRGTLTPNYLEYGEKHGTSVDIVIGVTI
ncbi:hypothetical protein LAZ67_8002366 [Cordylochernes scorpioides]|uniref:Transcription factor domain-containing protein n=1 Tax=Cordylochernes scorpioides TaxID=51811 RepID=A0ABY6KRF4_9ARAC|nr:hypothetical protein LAZ67_8002366 [Cordylochernes scorpioides]